jgi:DNA-binding HxlR family transcriptional regulator
MRTQNATSPATDVLSRKWTIQIVTALLHGSVRFSCLQATVAGISSKVLSCRLAELRHAGLVTRTPYEEIPPRVEYALSPAGLALAPVIAALEQWALNEGADSAPPGT